MTKDTTTITHTYFLEEAKRSVEELRNPARTMRQKEIVMYAMSVLYFRVRDSRASMVYSLLWKLYLEST